MGRSSSGRDRAGSELSSRLERRGGDDNDSSRRRSGADSMPSSRRKSSRRDGDDDDGASFAPTITEEPSEIPERRRNDSRRDDDYDDTRRRSSKGDRNGKDDRKRADSGGARKEDSRRDSQRPSKSSKKEKESAHTFGDHDATLPENQFPGEVPDTYTQPYRPPGLASEYYGDHGESVQWQPGVRPNQPSIVTNAEYAHLMEPTVDAKPPPEPSSIGQVGAAAGYFGSANFDSDSGPQTTPSKNARGSLSAGGPPKHSITGVSPRSSPGPQDSMSAFGQTTPARAVGAAAEYYTGGSGGSASAYQTPNRPPPGMQPGAAPYSAPAGIGGSQQHSNAAMYGGAAALAGAATGAYMSSQSQEHHSYAQHQTSIYNTASGNGYNQQGDQMHQVHQHKHKGLFGRFADWWRDPAAVAQYEQYTEAIGVCKYCFDPMSTPAEAPRRHNFRRRRPSSGSRYGSSTRVDKAYRYSSDEERRKRSSASKKVVLGGLASYGAAKVGDSIYKQRHDFEESGRPTNQSRVSFQEEPQHDRYGDVRLQRRNSDRKLSKADRSSRKDKHHRRRSSSSSSNSSSHNISRGTVMSTGAAAAGLAVAAATLDKKPRRRSRSRSPTSKKKYYSKRVSPMHSYVDLSTTNEGSGGLMGFFTSPSANSKKGKKPKGLFNFANASSSSSDADLRFGEGTVRRKPSNKRLQGRPAKPGDDHSAAAMMGLVAAGTALAAEADRRQEKGKRRHDANNYAGRDSRRTSEHRISMGGQATGGRDDDWYDTDGDAESDGSVDTALAYGGGVSAMQSRESLAQNRKSSRPSSYNFRQEDQQRYQDSLGRVPSGSTPSFPLTGAQSAAVAGVAGAIGGQIASNAFAQGSRPMGDLPPMHEIEPRPISDLSSQKASPQVTRVSSTSVPLQQPQPIVPVATFINGIGAEPFDTDRQPRREAQQSSSDRRRPRRDSSPAKLPTQDPRSSVNFDLTDEQLESERHAKSRDSRRKDSTNEMDRRKSADAAVLVKPSKPTDSSREEANQRRRRSSETTRRSSDADERVADIERELERLYEEHRQAEERKRKNSGIKKAAEGAAIGAAAAVIATSLAGKDSKAGSGDDSTPRRKSSLKKSRERESSPPETQQERIARMAAQRVRSTPSPVQHDDYSSFFVPTELREHLKEHNNKSEHRDDMDATVVEIVPGAPKPRPSHPFDPDNYRQFGLELDDDPTLYPWPVPMLGLVEPTPPGSQAHSIRGDETPIIEPKVTEPPEEFGEPLERRGSKVTWGDLDTYVYEVQTPDYERSNYVPDVEVREPKLTDAPSPDFARDEPGSLGEERQPRPNVGRTWTLEETEADKLEKEIPIVDDRPRMSRAWTVDDKEADQFEDRVSRSSPSDEPVPHIIEAEPMSQGSRIPSVVGYGEPTKAPTQSNESGSGHSQTFYQSPFTESVGDVGAMGDYNSPQPEAGRPATIMEQERRATDDDQSEQDQMMEPQRLETLPGPRLSKSEQRRRERASSSVNAVTPSGFERSSELEEDSVTPPPVPGTDSVFDYMVDNKAKSVPSASILGFGASAILAADQMAEAKDSHDHSSSREFVETDMPSKPRRSSTYDDSKPPPSRSDSKTGYQSDPEDWERSSDRKSKKSKSNSKIDVGAKSSSKSKGRHEADEAASVPLPRSSISGDLDEESTVSRRTRDDEKKSKNRRSKDADSYRDDDTRSVTSSTTDSKGKKKEAGGFFSNIFSASKSDVSTSSRKSSKSSQSEGRADRDDRSESRKKRKSRDKSDFDNVASAVSEPTRISRQSPEKGTTPSRDQSLDYGFVSAEETTESPINDVKDGESFLANRPEMPKPTAMDPPMGTDGVSGPTTERGSPTLPGIVASTPSKAMAVVEDRDLAAEDPEFISSPALPQLAESRRLSAIRTSDIPSSPIAANSPTAVPLLFRRPPMSPTNPRFSMSSPGADPSSPLTTPRTRQGRPKSTEFRNSKEFRPLYLVERSNFAKTTAPEPEEDLPSLPSSRTSSAHPSMEDLRAESQAQEQREYFAPSRMSAEMFRERGRRHSHSYWNDNEKRRLSPDYLDSRSATPVPSEAQRVRDSEKKPRPKYEFHSPSELLQDPALHDVPFVDDEETPQSPLPSVASTDFDQEYMSARSRSLSPTRARSLSRGRRSASTRSTSASWHDAMTTATAGVLAGSTLGIAGHEILKKSSDDEAPEVTTPRKFEFSQEETAPLKESDASSPLQERHVTLPSMQLEQQETGSETTRHANTQPDASPEVVRDAGAWNNVFAEIKNQKRSTVAAAESPPVVAPAQPDSGRIQQDTGAWKNILAQIQKRNPSTAPVAGSLPAVASEQSASDRDLPNTGTWKNVFAQLQNRKRSIVPVAEALPAVTVEQPESDKNQPDTSTWKNVFSQIQSRKSSTIPVAGFAPSITSEQSESNRMQPDPAIAISLPAFPDAGRPPEPSEALPSARDVPMASMQEEADISGKADAEEQFLESEVEFKQSKKEKKNKKKKRSSLALDDLPLTAEDSTLPEKSDTELRDLSASLPSVKIDTKSRDIPQSAMRAIIDEGPSNYDKSGDPPLEDPMKSPLEHAFEAAFNARGLAEGATIETAFHSFQPEIPDVGGTQLTTIREENEVATPASEQENPSAELAVFPDRKSSKKEKRKQKKSKQVSLDDWEEPSPIPVDTSDKLEAETQQPEQVVEADRPLPEEIILAEPTPVKERPNPFGDDFEIKPPAVALPTATISSRGPDTPGDEDSEFVIAKKGKKDKKKKNRQSYNWEEETPAEQAKTKREPQATEAVTPARRDDTKLEPVNVPQSGDILEEDTFTTPVETTQREPEDPWEMSVKPGKKKSKSKKKSLPAPFEDTPTPALEETFATIVPASEPEGDVQLMLGSGKAQDSVLPDRSINEPDLNAQFAPISSLPMPASAERPHSQADRELAAPVIPEVAEEEQTFPSDATKAEQILPPQPQEKSARDQRLGSGLPVGAALASALLASAKIAAPAKEGSQILEVTDAATDPVLLGDADGFVASEKAQTDFETAPREPRLAQEKELLPITRTKAKKDKKKNRTITSDDEEIVSPAQEPPLAEEEAIKPDTIPDMRDKSAFEAPATSASAEAQSEIPPAPTERSSLPQTSVEDRTISSTPVDNTPQQDDDFFSIPAKKSKKDKKKKRQSIPFDPEVAPSTEAETTVDDQVAEPNLAREVEAMEAAKTLDTTAPEPEDAGPAQDAPQQDEDLFPASTRKSKKDKKKKRASTFPLDELDVPSAEQVEAPEQSIGDSVTPKESVPEDTPPAAEIERPEAGLVPTLADGVLPQDDDDFAFAKKSKKSNKDKKKRRTLIDDFDETPGADVAGQDNTDLAPTTIPEQTQESGAPIEHSGRTDGNFQSPESISADLTGADLAPIPGPNITMDSGAERFQDDVASDGTRDTILASLPPSRDRALTEEPKPKDPSLTKTTLGLPLDEVAEPSEVKLTRSDAFSGQDLINKNVAVDAAIIKPFNFEAPVVQSPVDEAATTDLPTSIPPERETKVDLSVGDEAQIVLPAAVETPAVEPATVQAPVVETPADRDGVVEAASTDVSSLKTLTFEEANNDYTDAPTAHETSFVQPSAAALEPVETSAWDTSAHVPITATVETAPIETPVIETLGFETPVSETMPDIPGGFDTPAEDDWGFPVKKSKKDKKKKRQSAPATEAVTAGPTTADFEPPTEAIVVPTREDMTGTTAHEPPPLDTDARDVDVLAQEDAQDEWAPTSKQKKDKKKKKRQSALSELTEPEESRDFTEDTPEIQIVDAEPMTHLEKVPDSTVGVETSAEKSDAGAAGPDGSDSREAAEIAPTDEWAFTTAKSRKDKKKKKPQSMFADDVVEVEAAAEDVNSTPADANAFEYRTRDAIEIVPEEPIPQADDYPEVQAADVRANEPPTNETTAQDIPEDEWAFTSTKSKKDEKKKRQSVVDSAGTEPVNDEALDVYPQAEPNVEAHGLDGTGTIAAVDEVDRDIGVTFPEVAPEDAWAPAVKKKKDKKKSRKSNLAEDFALAGDEQEVLKESATEEAPVPVEEHAMAHTTESPREEALTVAAAHDSALVTKAEDMTTMRALPEPASTPYLEDTSVPDDKVTEEAIMSGANNAALQDQAPDYFSVSRKKSKKDKKKSRYVAFDEPETTDAFETPMEESVAADVLVTPLEKTETVDTADAGDHLPDVTEGAQPADNELATSTKTMSKKDKKKQRQSIYEDLEPVDVLETPFQEDIAVRPATEGTIPEADENRVVSTKSKSKKDKKKRQSTFEESFAEPAPAMPEVDLPHEQSIGEVATRDLTTRDEFPEVPTTIDDEWDVPRKEKKEKKKKRQSTFDETFPDPAIATIPSPVQAEADDWDAPKKSKKDKKNKRQSTFADIVDDPAVMDNTIDPIVAAETDTHSPALQHQESPPFADHSYTAPSTAFESQDTRITSTPDLHTIGESGEFHVHEEPRAELPVETTSEQMKLVEPASSDIAMTMGADELQADLRQAESRSETLDEQPEVAATDDVWVSKPKKSEKKKRQPIFDAIEIDSPHREMAEKESIVQSAVTDPVAEPSIAEIADQPATEATIEDAWAMPAKKSKKSKKNPPSAFDGTAFDSPAQEAEELFAEQEPTTTEAEATIPYAAAETLAGPQMTEPVADEEGASSTKRSKQDKKKRRTLLAEDELQPPTSAVERSLGEALAGEQPYKAEVTARPLEQSEVYPVPEVHISTDQPAEATTLVIDDHMQSQTERNAPTAEPPAAEDEWAFPTKSSKKDKKKKKQVLALGDFDMLDYQPTSSAEPTYVEDGLKSLEQPGTNVMDKMVDSDTTRSEIIRGEPQPLRLESFDAQPAALEHMEQAPAVTVREVEESFALSPVVDAMDVDHQQSIIDPQSHSVPNHEMDNNPREAPQLERGLVSMTEESFAPPAKVSKKGKGKSKRGPTLDDSFGPEKFAAEVGEMPQLKEAIDTTQAGTVTYEQQPTSELVPAERQAEEEWGFSTKKSKKKSKKSKALTVGDEFATPGTETPISTDQFESAAQTPLERIASPEPMEDVKAAKTPAGQPETVVEDYFSVAPSKKKSKKDKKRSLLAWGADELPIEDTSEPATPAPVPEPLSDSGLSSTVEAFSGPVASDFKVAAKSNERSATTEAVSPRDVHDYNDTYTRTHQGVLPQQDQIAPNTQPTRDVDLDATSPEPVQPTLDEQAPERKKSKKDKKGRRTFEFDGVEQVEPPVIEPEETDTRELDVMETIHEESMHPSPAPVSTNISAMPRETEDLSDVSESTRERRRRRRSPPVWSGEPADLPRDRALTPPPEQDNIMDTALGIAAGLGFGESESTREVPRRGPSPARQESSGWSFGKLAPGVSTADSKRDSGVQFESPILATDHFSSTRDSGFIPSPAVANDEFSPSRNHSVEMKLRPPRPQSPTSSTEDLSQPRVSRTRHEEAPLLETPKRRPSSVESTSKDRSSVLFNSSPAMPSPLITTGISRSPETSKSPLQRSPSIHGHHHSREELRQQKAKAPRHDDSDQFSPQFSERSATAAKQPASDAQSRDRGYTPGKPLGAIREDSAEASPAVHPFSEPSFALAHQKHTSDKDISAAGLAAAGVAGIALAAGSRDAGAKSLGRSKSRTSSLRNLRGNSTSPFDPTNIASSSSPGPVNARDTGKAAVRDRDMADIYVSLLASAPPRFRDANGPQDGYGSYPGSPKSTTRPQSVRRRQSMQQIQDLESRLDQLASENRALVEAKIVAEQHLEQAHFEQNRAENSTSSFDNELQKRDAEIARLRQEVASLIATHASLQQEHEQNLFNIQQGHEQAQYDMHGSSKELETLRSRHNELSTGMESIVRHEIDSALMEKNAEVQRLRVELEVAREQIRELQSQILERPVDEVVSFHDEDYFDQACQKLCQQVQGWVLRFSKFSDLKLCRSTNEVRDEKIVDRFDNAILDGSDVDNYLTDRVRRRDVFMSVVMTMIWEYVFTRYLFGMDRDQRQKLKQLEKNLGEVGPTSAVHKWRALTLTLLSKRESFKAQRESDTEAVAIEIFSTLSRFLPPPQNLEDQIVGSLRNVMRTAVDLSIEMRTQHAEYIMLPPLQPEYDTNGDLARKVYFNASLMNERSGETTSNEDLQQEQAIVRMVLFPLVVKKGDDNGVGDDEIVVCPAQVLIARPDKVKKARGAARLASGGSDARSLRAISTHSLAMSGIEGNENMF